MFIACMVEKNREFRRNDIFSMPFLWNSSELEKFQSINMTFLLELINFQITSNIFDHLYRQGFPIKNKFLNCRVSDLMNLAV